ncbi:MAG: hypothetical protein CVU24_02475 [Betaproteobacteria bacterium HGW-Betaproteobacteria-18]|nr:MAG: hypothetical protein CVU24_02475 [Betaproteobacteria bacterium HGW-Betaproteobacteria-18]
MKLIEQAIQARPSDATFYYNLGKIHQDLGQPAGAVWCYRQALLRQPDFVDAMLGLGTVLMVDNRLDEAIDSYLQAISARPDCADAYYNLGTTLQAKGQLQKAVANYRQALLLNPSIAVSHRHLVDLLAGQDKLDDTIQHFQQILLSQPDAVDAHMGLGTALREQGRLDEAIVCYQHAIELQPDDADAYYNLACALHDQGQLDQAAANYQQALFYKPSRVLETYSHLGNVLEAQGKLEDAIASYRQALLLAPDDAAAHSSLLFTMQYASDMSPAQRFQEHQRFAERFEAPFKPSWQAHTNNRDPERRLKVGYVSGDFRNHPVAFFIEPILANHDKSQVEVFGYYNHTQINSDTRRIAAFTDHWLACSDLNDEQLDERIRADGIDILVDLSGHTARNRLLVFARKPAPLQATWIGYSGSTGLTAMDYRITDAWMDPPGMTERYHSEALVRLPHGGLAFIQEPGCPEVNALPALSAGKLVFASLNTLNKINPAVVNVWGRILRALPQARLMLGNVTDGSLESRLLGLFEQVGIGASQLILQPRLTGADYLAIHQQIDIALDPFPYNGGTTTMHSLWMGVPVITLEGDHPLSRFGASLMSRVGLPEFICQSEDDYVQCALELAQDLPGLNRVRQSMRQRMSGPAWDAANITHNLETAYRDLWRTWCSQ